jgi:hypothetical protein
VEAGRARAARLRRRLLVLRDLLQQLGDLLRLLLDHLLELRDPAAAVVGLDAGASAVVAGSAAGGEVLGFPEQMRRLRRRDQMVDGGRVAGTARPLELADVTVVGEHGFAEPLPSRRRIAAIGHRQDELSRQPADEPGAAVVLLARGRCGVDHRAALLAEPADDPGLDPVAVTSRRRSRRRRYGEAPRRRPAPSRCLELGCGGGSGGYGRLGTADGLPRTP